MPRMYGLPKIHKADVSPCVIYSHNEYAYIQIYMFMQKYTYIYWIHTDAMNNRRRKEDAGRLL